MKFKRFLAYIALASMTLVGCGNAETPVASNETTPENTMELKILATTDVHDYLMNYDYYTTSESDNYGMVKLATLIKGYQAETPEVNDYVLVDNGDLIQGNPLGDFFNEAEPVEAGTTHPIYEIFEALGYDVLGLGNHEFNYGLEYLHQIIEDTTIPVINSNVFNAETKEHEFTPSVLLNKQVVDADGNVSDIKVGVLNVVPEQILNWDGLLLQGKVTVQDMKEAAQTYVTKLREEGADIVVALAHTGYGDAEYIEGEENVAAELTKIEGLDVVIGGHSHQVFPAEGFDTTIGEVDLAKGTINGTLTVQPAKYGEGLGVVSLKLTKDENGKFVVVDGKAENVSAEGVENEAETEALLQPYHQQVIDYVNAPVGKIATPLTSFFALVGDDASAQIIAEAQMEYAKNLMETTTELAEYKELPILSAAAPFKAGFSKGGTNPDDYVDIAAGDVSIKDVSNLYKFPNTLCILKLKGADVKEWLEMAAGMYNQIEEGKEGQALLNPDFPSFLFDSIEGVTYEIDVTQPMKYDSNGNVINETAERIVNLQYQGAPIDLNQEFLVVTNNYRAGGGGNFPIFPTGEELIYTSVDETRQILANYIASEPEFTPTVDNNWKLKTLAPGTKVTFDSNSKATTFLENYPAITASTEIGENLTQYVYDLGMEQ
ncbi:MAG: bifunctional 2',3'-cyclic-nucleotide 2'-phosphodiesterase/3'-nucleotidase [Cellulosilyticum sp.]|nr:bifunctional 2',3'-cyclic-nucleotide 2'-phosphodiesterase/3'-nucleotidase [Cellulosilyticum sp.]